ncbi:amidohydrolase family protein [Actinomadura macrotermitis]|uniref:Coagulation factor 5/8 type domain-containing protein n=1 Tax=Actinomadura macrotermitis TaxID=2585200 RepID=A0A7K0C1L2_9ACTN|nr:membrane dipeptidase [Actinomadura macrotermitis]MQY06674.1 hypothetical protein [Actinomadura macrotermitis]
MSRRHPVVLAILLLSLLVAPAASGAAPPDADVGVDGAPFTGTDAQGRVRGYIDAHSHPMAYEAFGGRLMCGKPWDPDGPAAALRDCPDHEPNGVPAWYENFTRRGTPFGTHDTRGWPTFKDWPAYDSRTHQQTYYRWLERSWRAGQRVLVNDLVANRVLCDLYPLKKNSCDEMDTIRLEARRTRELQDYIDRQNGGPGRGWFRIVRGPAEARAVIKQGKLAVVLGIEASEPFGCKQVLGKPQCTAADIDRGLDEVRRLGVSSMFLCHKFDNALCGIRFDEGITGVLVNTGNAISSGRFWQADTCTGPQHDSTLSPVNDALAGPLRFLRPAGITLPVYPKAPHCNVNGLTALGEHMVRGMIKRGMIVEVDHMSVKAAGRTLDLLEQAHYSGVISSHSWMDAAYARRVYRLGGMVAPYASTAASFTEGWKAAKAQRDGRYLFGYGYGLDANGMGALPGRREGSAVRYPFTSPFDKKVTVRQLRTGERNWDLNTDGVAHYGLVPDWLKDATDIGGPALTEDLSLGAEAYLQMWQRASGVR